MSEQEPGTASTTAPVAARAVPAQRRGTAGMLGLFTAERAAALAEGRRAVAAACDAVFPPRPEDPRGLLLPAELQREASSRVAAAVARTTSDRERTWVLEGVVVGFAEQATAALQSRGLTDPAALLRARARARPAPTAAGRSAVDAVLAVVDACSEADAVALGWAVECLWTDGADGASVRTVLSVAASACTACLDVALDG